MIGLLKGVVAAIGEDAALIEVNGVGYVAQAGARTLGRLSVGEAATLYVETHVREDAIKLFGFLSEEERGWFVHLQSAPGVGAKVALAILDVLSPTELADAIALEDRASIARANGVGPKLAARIAQELSGKAPPRGFGVHGALSPSPRAVNDGGAPAGGAGARNEAVSALVNLGIDQASAARAVAAAAKSFKDEPPTGELIRAALRETSR
ncbi:MAG: Holliday junction branch migration protein RuvA [Alphaproteobacteria bacterium]|nr:Holliday junction branch migration protein RuvA [Alphaproteobacteria bacterium]